MTEDVHQSRAKLATRLAFVAAGFGVACWAPLVPFAKTRCHLGDAAMGLALLLLGAGSIVAMPLAANLSARFSSKPIVLSSGLGLAVILTLLSIVSSPIALGVALFAFGASLGSLDVAMNLHAVDVEPVRPLPSTLVGLDQPLDRKSGEVFFFQLNLQTMLRGAAADAKVLNARDLVGCLSRALQRVADPRWIFATQDDPTRIGALLQQWAGTRTAQLPRANVTPNKLQLVSRFELRS